MDFSHAKMQKMTQKSRSKLRSRWDDLCSLIALDVAVGQEIFELAPISEYELYIRNFGNANSNQVIYFPMQNIYLYYLTTTILHFKIYIFCQQVLQTVLIIFSLWISLVLTQCKGCFSSYVKKKISFVIFKNRICYCFEIQENFFPS